MVFGEDGMLILGGVGGEDVVLGLWKLGFRVFKVVYYLIIWDNYD